MSDPLKEKAFVFALRIVRLAEYLHEKKEFSLSKGNGSVNHYLSKKILDSGVNIGLFIEEARQGEDRTDFRQKYSLANKEAFKTNYLLRLIHGGRFIPDKQFNSFLADCEELQKMLISALKTLGRPE